MLYLRGYFTEEREEIYLFMSIERVEAYRVKEERMLEGLSAKATLLEHKKTGARVVLLENEDKNKVFQIGFRTPVKDSTGVPHIMEHSVLCGSRNFPVKDPFVELVKGSLNTFLNAMTYPDKTVYPVASCNDKDFQNLMHVYMDAVFYPNIYQKKEIFLQEGWSYKLEDIEGKLEYNGVVYNEMKGAFSSPEGVLDRVVLNTLFPDTSYANESGGDPECIPDLTYEEFLEFHRTYYHPSNSYIYLYGKMDMEEKLRWLDAEYLQHFQKLEVDSAISLQKPFSEMKEKEIFYSITNEEGEEDNTYLSYNKVIGTNLDRELYLAFQILDYVLLSAPGAVLKKALLEQQIGKDIMGSYDNSTYQPVFSVVAKNANPEEKEAFVQTVEDTLRHLVEKGIDKRALEAGINYHEFRSKEADFGNYPKGLMYGLQMMDSWLYDDNSPFLHLEAEALFPLLRERVGTGYYEDLIRTYLLENPHGAVVTVLPEKGRTLRLDKELEEKLQTYKESLAQEEREALVRQTQRLLEYQSSEEREEDIQKIPVLKRTDISREVEPVYNEKIMVSETPVILHDIETNGIGYVDFLFYFTGIEEELLPYVGILQAVLGIIDTENFEYGEFFDEINVHTGGIETSLELYPDLGDSSGKEYQCTFEVKAKALFPKLPVAFRMTEEMLLRSKLEDEKRLKEILSMVKSRLLMKFQSAGHATAIRRAASYASPASRVKELTGGIAFYEVVKRLEEHFEEEKEGLKRQLRELAKRLFCRENLCISYTAPKKRLSEIESCIKTLEQKLWKGQAQTKIRPVSCKKEKEGFQTASKVQYVAQAGNFREKGFDYVGTLQILRVILSYDYLWQNVRVKGGAYGCMSGFSRTGEGYFASYRDPNLRKTLEVYRGVVEYLRTFQVTERDMTKYIIGTISNLDQPMMPAAAGDRSMNLHMCGLTLDRIREERRQILEAGQEDIRKLADIVEAVLEAGQICVVGSEEKLREDRELFDVITGF